MKTLIEKIANTIALEIPKSQHDYGRVVSAYGDVSGESTDSWFVQCSHLLNAPADIQLIAETERRLGFPIPSDYKEFLRICNGAKLFIVPRNRPQGGEPHVRYHVFSCEELLVTNEFLLRTFLGAYTGDPEYNGLHSLNYMAFCDATNDNYQALVLEGDYTGRVFLLFNEFQCRPYNEIDSAFYYTISESLESWFDLIHESGGWGGRGAQSGSL